MKDTPSADPTLAAYVTDLGGRLEEAGPKDLAADFGERRITVRFG
jgi:hypothetical protein